MDGLGGVYCEKSIIDSDGLLVSDRDDKRTYTGQTGQIHFNRSFYSLKTQGCLMCVSRRVLDKYIELDMPECGHDSQCGRIALLYSSLWHIDEQLIQYRIHRVNTSGISKDMSFGASSLDKRLEEISGYNDWFIRLIADEELSEEKKQIIRDCDKAIKVREKYLGGKGFFIELLKYKAYYSGLSMLVGDFAYRHGLNKVLGKIRWMVRR